MSAMKIVSTFTFLLVVLTACEVDHGPPQLVGEVKWSDGDSGYVDGTPFRLSGVDAPETTKPGGRSNAAKCDAEQTRGVRSKAYMRELTYNAELTITRNLGEDRYGRLIITLSADGVDVGESGIMSGHLKRWPLDGVRSLRAKPSWCP